MLAPDVLQDEQLLECNFLEQCSNGTAENSCCRRQKLAAFRGLQKITQNLPESAHLQKSATTKGVFVNFRDKNVVLA